MKSILSSAILWLLISPWTCVNTPGWLTSEQAVKPPEKWSGFNVPLWDYATLNDSLSQPPSSSHWYKSSTAMYVYIHTCAEVSVLCVTVMKNSMICKLGCIFPLSMLRCGELNQAFMALLGSMNSQSLLKPFRYKYVKYVIHMFFIVLSVAFMSQFRKTVGERLEALHVFLWCH